MARKWSGEDPQSRINVLGEEKPAFSGKEQKKERKKMAVKKKVDEYPQFITGSVDCLAVAGGDIEKVPTAYSPKDRIGLLLQSMEFEFARSKMMKDYFNPSNIFSIGLSFLATLPTTSYGYQLDDVGLLAIVSKEFIELDLRTFDMHDRIFFKDFSQYKGGGIICHPSSLYVWNAHEAAGSGNTTIKYRIGYNTIVLDEAMYRELWELRVTSQMI